MWISKDKPVVYSSSSLREVKENVSASSQYSKPGSASFSLKVV